MTSQTAHEMKQRHIGYYVSNILTLILQQTLLEQRDYRGCDGRTQKTKG